MAEGVVYTTPRASSRASVDYRDPPSSKRMGNTSRLSGFNMSPKVSSVTAPSNALSCGSPHTTGDVAVRPAIVNRASATLRPTTDPSASANSAKRVGVSPSDFHVRSGTTL